MEEMNTSARLTMAATTGLALIFLYFMFIFVPAIGTAAVELAADITLVAVQNQRNQRYFVRNVGTLGLAHCSSVD